MSGWHIALVVLLATASPRITSASVTDSRLSPEEFPIIAWNQVVGDQRTFEEMRECGFNVAGFARPDQLGDVAAANMKAIVYDPRTPIRLDDAATEENVRQAAGNLADQVGSHPALLGYYLGDEPNGRDFPALARWIAAFKAVSSDKISYINLLSSRAAPEQLGAANYTRYLESAINVLKIPCLSYAHYALMEDGTIKDGYFENLELIRAAGLRHRTPFWSMIMATGCMDYAEPTEAGLRFQVYSSLAYGTRGLSWFTYFTPSTGNFRMGPIDPFGAKTATWDILRRVNLQIHRLGPVFLQLKSINVFHYPKAPRGGQDMTAGKYLTELNGGEFVVGEFVGPRERPFVMIVNKSLNRSARLSASFKPTGIIKRINPYTGESEPFDSEHGWLAPGQGALLTIEPSSSGAQPEPPPKRPASR